MGSKPRQPASSHRHVALLRGINVGGHHIVPMARLRELVTALGVGDVATYIQSGNVVFTAADARARKVGAEISDAIDREFGFRITVTTRTSGELAGVIANNPFAGADAKTLHVAFLDPAPDPQRLASVDRQRVAPDKFVVVDREIYLHCPGGIGRSKLNAGFFNSFGSSWTVRNWRTVNGLLEMSRS